MEIIALIHLDKLLINKTSEEQDEVVRSISNTVILLERCHTITKSIFMTSCDIGIDLENRIDDELSLKIRTSPSSDPLNEFYEAASTAKTTASTSLESIIVRIDLNQAKFVPETLDAMIENHIRQGHHYSRNQQCNNDMKIEVMNFSVLDEAWREALLPDDRINITPYIFRQEQRLNLGYFPPERISSFNA